MPLVTGLLMADTARRSLHSTALSQHSRKGRSRRRRKVAMKLLSPSRFCNSFPSPLPHNPSVKFSSISFSSFQFSPAPCSSHSISSHTRNHSYNTRIRRKRNIFIGSCTTSSKNVELESKSSDSNGDSSSSPDFDCVGTGLDVECLVSSSPPSETNGTMLVVEGGGGGGGDESKSDLLEMMVETGVLVSPFFFWGTAMVAMKEVLPLVGPFFVAAFRLIPAGLLLVAFAASKGRPLPSGFTAWLSIALFGLVDAACFQGFLAEGLQRTSAGLGSVIIDSQPLTVAVLAALLFGESIGLVGAAGLVLGVIGLILLELPALAIDESNFSLWGSGEWWMLLAAQSMAVGTVMVRWVTKYSDPVMATGWHMVIGGIPLVVISILNHDPAFSGSLKELTGSDILALLYTSIFGSAISYGVYFYSATKGSLTKLSSLTFLTPMFASIFGFLYLGETFSPSQLIGAVVTLIAIYMVNYRDSTE